MNSASYEYINMSAYVLVLASDDVARFPSTGTIPCKGTKVSPTTVGCTTLQYT